MEKIFSMCQEDKTYSLSLSHNYSNFGGTDPILDHQCKAYSINWYTTLRLMALYYWAKLSAYQEEYRLVIVRKIHVQTRRLGDGH